MKTIMRLILCSALYVSAATTFTPAASAGEFFVSPAGSDTNPGTMSGPFATPQRAMAAVRALVARGLKEDVRVIFDAGVYELTAPLVFTPADSGTAEHPVTYAAAAGKTVVISGGRRISNWKQDGQTWTSDLPDVRSGKWFFRLLVVNSERAVRARWPNEDGVLHIASVADEVRTFSFDRALPAGNFVDQDAELVVYENWSVSRARIASQADGRLSTATSVGWIGHGDATTASPGKPAFVEHARACLDQPGEWFLDRKAGVLTYLARDGEKPTPTAAVAPVLSQLVKIAGAKGKPVRNVRFEGLRFEHTDFELPALGYSEIQAAHYGPNMKEPTYAQPVAIECAFAEGIRFEDCRFAHLNASGLGFGPGCRKNSLSRCTLEDIGGNGIMIGWRGTGQMQAGAEGSLDADWADPADAPTGNEVVNCEIRRCGSDSRGGVGVFVAFSGDTRIAHNEIHDLPYTGISVGYRWNTTPTSQTRCLVEYNHIHDLMKKLADGGGIYTLGYQPGTILRGNLIHNVHRSAYAHGGAPNNGFFIDEGSKGFLFESNVVYETSGTSVRFNQNQRDWHTWKSNSFDDAVTPTIIAEAGKFAGVEKGNTTPVKP
ncbi:MAG: right-handed parallel beta-helix repeat-containing protein [Verrucomicrobia bacterium]|nr:right-handed parallel beta-helix repeat-containing protein [Verrucomicrobiota bacterium]